MSQQGPTATSRHVCATSAIRGRADSMCRLRASPPVTRRQHRVTGPVAEHVGSIQLDVGRLNDWRPAGNVALHECNELLRPSFRLVRNVATDIDKALAHVAIVKCIVERSGELVEN